MVGEKINEFKAQILHLEREIKKADVTINKIKKCDITHFLNKYKHDLKSKDYVKKEKLLKVLLKK